MSNEAIKLADQFGGHWCDHPTFGAEDWRNEVAENNTRASYWDWVVSMIACQAETD